MQQTIFHGSLLIDLANASWTTLKFFGQRITKEDLLPVGQNNLLAESDGFTFGARIHNGCDFHAGTKCGPAVSQSGQLADIAVFDCPSRDLSGVVFHIQKDGDVRIAPKNFLHSALQRELGLRVCCAPAMMRQQRRGTERQNSGQYEATPCEGDKNSLHEILLRGQKDTSHSTPKRLYKHLLSLRHLIQKLQRISIGKNLKLDNSCISNPKSEILV